VGLGTVAVLPEPDQFVRLALFEIGERVDLFDALDLCGFDIGHSCLLSAHFQLVDDYFETLECVWNYLDCGNLHNGFARIRCADCGHVLGCAGFPHCFSMPSLTFCSSHVRFPAL
jgi:hypothetical protein